MRDDEDAAGFDEAFETLFLRAFRLAHRMLGDRLAAEDVAAEALAVTALRWRRVRGMAHRDAWVLRVTTNLALKALRRRSRLATFVLDADTEPRRGGASEFERDAALRVALSAALRQLPRRQREAVVLRYLSGLSEPEVAGALGVAPGTVKMHLHRGVQALRARLGGDLDEVGVGFAVE